MPATRESAPGSATRRSRRTGISRATARLATPRGFVFERTVFSHGWFDLLPFAWDPVARRLRCTLSLAAHGGPRAPVVLAISGSANGTVRLDLEAAGRPRRRLERTAVTAAGRAVRRMLRLDEDLAGFYARASRVVRPDLRWAEGCGAGRLLRGASVYEDLVKLICTTNCSWSLTRVMVSGLVRGLGAPAGDGSRAFPTPEAMAEAPPRFYREVVRAGYRGTALRALARRVADGDLSPERWLDPDLEDDAVRTACLDVDGAGPYVADNLMKLLGRYAGLGIDAWCRRAFSRLHARGRKVTDARLERFYAPFGPWRGLALWCDITREWFGSEGEERAREKFTDAAF